LKSERLDGFDSPYYIFQIWGNFENLRVKKEKSVWKENK